MLTNTTHSFMAPKSMSSEKENIELKSKEKKHGQIEFVRTNCPAAHNTLIIVQLQAPGQTSRTNSICPCFIFLAKTGYKFYHRSSYYPLRCPWWR